MHPVIFTFWLLDGQLINWIKHLLIEVKLSALFILTL